MLNFSNASLATRPTTPDINSNARKRKLDDGTYAIDRRPFKIRPSSTDPVDAPRTLTPICLLPRSQLPLAYLDVAQRGNRLFSAHMQTLEACHEYEDETHVLVVEDQNEGRLYAIERVTKRNYALCRLGRWVKSHDLVEKSKSDVPAYAPQTKRRIVDMERGVEPWWTTAKVEVELEVLTVKPSHMPSLDMRNKSEALLSLNRPCARDPATVSKSGDHDLPVHESLTSKSLSPEETLEELAGRYLDALYLSKTPLAYFVKGPLARARTAFLAQPLELVSFLRGALLSSTISDKKYRVCITDLIKELPLQKTPNSKPKSRRKRKWKPKRDKKGFFTGEKDYVEQWWRKCDETSNEIGYDETIDAAIRRRTQRLRNRETFLQVILILEINALEASVPQADLAAAKLKNLEPPAQESQGGFSEGTTRKLREWDTSFLLDTLLDRLCIWHSIEGDLPAKSAPSDKGTATDNENDDLKSFASEVVYAFYHARIPGTTSATSKRLGGPSAPNTAPRRITSMQKKPGEPATRQPPQKKPRRPLERVSTDTLNRSGKLLPALHRSATDSDTLATLIKREMSQTPPLDSIPWAKGRVHKPAHSGSRAPTSWLQQVSSGRREIDLSAVSQATKMKMRKKAENEEKLREAIDTLKKPNRNRAVEDVAKQADESFARAIAKTRKPAAPRKPVEQNDVAISATPRHVKATPAPRRQAENVFDPLNGYESTQAVPASSLRPLSTAEYMPNSTPNVPQTGQRYRQSATVEDTPSRGFARFMPAALSHEPGTLMESPTTGPKAPISRSLGVASKMPSLAGNKLVACSPKTSTVLKGRTYSPIKYRSLPEVRDEQENSGFALKTAKSPEQDVYAALGWDDEDCEELT